MALHDSESAQRFFAGGEGGDEKLHAVVGWGCVEATNVSTRVSSPVDEATPIRAKIPALTTEMRLAWARPYCKAKGA